jgi:sec-independent protein translocase protein TatA
MPFSIGPMELVLLVGFALLVFGPKRLPELGRSVGNGVRELRRSMSEEPKEQ